jgi:hypothetical protein
LEQKLKYQNLLNQYGLSAQCPPDIVKPKKIEGFHFVNNPIDSELNFRPSIIKSPRRINCADKNIHCSIFALSFFDTEENARKMFSNFPDRTKQLLGYTNLAAGLLVAEMGLCSEPNNYGHFDFYEFEGINLTQHLQIIGAL